MRPAIRVAAIGWRARAALAATGGVARVLASLRTSAYLDAGGTVLWLGRADGPRHARALLADTPPPRAGDAPRFDWAGLHPWRPPQASPACAARLGAGALDLLDALRHRDRTGARPAGLGGLLVGQPLAFPLAGAAGAVRAVARACARDAPTEAAAAAEALLGLGPGLTPSGDDFVGGVLFARRILAPDGAAWSAAATSLARRARTRTHPVSAALLSDLAHGEGHAPLHDLVEALAAEGAAHRALRAVDQLGSLGHSSGWDILTGLLVGLAGPAALARPSAAF